MKEEKREIQAPPNKQLIMDIGKTKYKNVQSGLPRSAKQKKKRTGL